MRTSIMILLALTACGFDHGATAPDDGGHADAAKDGPTVDANPLCYGQAPNFSVCLAAPPTRSVVIAGNVDTDGNTTCNSGDGVVMTVGGTTACVLAYTDVSFSAGFVTTRGDKPLVIIASGTLTLAQTVYLNVSSVRGSLGPGAPAADCGTSGDGGSATAGAGGGAGGSFGTAGFGGAGGGGAVGGTANAAAVAPVGKLRGGCPGGTGGVGNDDPGDPGPGGGAVYLIARSTLAINGTINASGGGGEGGHNAKGGGGGGGSGGMIVLHGNPLVIGATASIFANGGGGGGGAGMAPDGKNGGDPMMIGVAAPGGGVGMVLMGGETAGGNGATRTSPAGVPNPTTAGAGGGGGGGGLGVIRLLTPPGLINAANFSPAPS